MNVQLNKLLEKHNISPENKYEILQIFAFLPDEKKQNLLNNFEIIAIKLEKIDEAISIEREILVSTSFEKIKNKIFEKRKEKSPNLQKQIEELKREI